MTLDFGTRATGFWLIACQTNGRSVIKPFVSFLLCVDPHLYSSMVTFFLDVEVYFKGWTIIDASPNEQVTRLILYSISEDLLFSKTYCRHGIWAYRAFDIHSVYDVNFLGLDRIPLS